MTETISYMGELIDVCRGCDYDVNYCKCDDFARQQDRDEAWLIARGHESAYAAATGAQPAVDPAAYRRR